MKTPQYSYFRAEALTEPMLREKAPSIFAQNPMEGVSDRYAFVPTARILDGLRQLDWIPVEVEEQRIRKELRRGFQKHLIRFRRVAEMRCLEETVTELVLINSHDGGCAYQLHAGLYRRICSNGLVVSNGSFEAMRFRHAHLEPDQIMQASLRVVDAMPEVGRVVSRFRNRILEPRESTGFAAQALRMRYGDPEEAPITAGQLLQARRIQDQGPDLWRTLNRVQENLIRGGLGGSRTDGNGRRRSMRPLRGIESKLGLNKDLWELAEQFTDHVALPTPAVGMAE